MAYSTIQPKTNICWCGKVSYQYKECGFHRQVKYQKRSMERRAEKTGIPSEELKAVNDRFWKEVWNSREHISDLSGVRLPEHDPHSPKFVNLIKWHQHHIFHKANNQFPELSYDEAWIILVTKSEHDIIHFGSNQQKILIGYLDKLKEIRTQVQNTHHKLRDKMLLFLNKQIDNIENYYP